MTRLRKIAAINTQNQFDEGGQYTDIGQSLQSGLKFDFAPLSITGHSDDNEVMVNVVMNNGDNIDYTLTFAGGDIKEHLITINEDVVELEKDEDQIDPVRTIFTKYKSYLASKGWTSL